MAAKFAAGLFIILLVAPIAVYGVTHSVDWNLSTNYNSLDFLNSVSVGDTIVFTYDKSTHSVLGVSKDAYENCNKNNPSFNDDSGNTSYKLTKEGAVYFICGTAGHCPPMKLQVNVKAASSSSSGGSPSSSPTPTSTTPTTSSTPSSSKNGAPAHGLSWAVFVVSLVFGTFLTFMG